MKIWADYHTHTRYSHGTGTIEQNVKAAIEKGLRAVGISEHGPGNIGLRIKLKDFYKMRDEIERLKSKYKNIKILLGCEANVISLDGDLDIPNEVLSILDYTMVGLHPLIWPRSFKDGLSLLFENVLARAVGSNWLLEKVMRQNTLALIRAISKNKIKIITHPGLHLPIDTAKLAQAAAKYGTALEINAGHGYMTKEYIAIAKACGAKFAIGSDAHHPKNVGNFKRALEIVKEVGLSEDDIINAE
ncbi:MAG TPA: PHP domain-containing protein [Thermoanaerobacterales bacterium]|uniref:PHP domain-containing protein n=1 Tax=Tepidanaerobacter sp. GT38 TaxID=2722793 RepID=UPI0017F12B4E|nr:PHP domain-containing protein [Tepidanaerobacter sp. GT38]MCG1012482.1 PHP domain-containing protein [Tepidanaerobacter sp. GT38]HHY42933.1 PHP domain-containing protein [Thermoanaerobacterales bacterium]